LLPATLIAMKAFFSIVGFAFLVGCGGGGIDGVIKEYEGFKDKMCACKDAACAEKVQADANAFIMKAAEKFKDSKPSKEQDEKFDKIQNAMEECEKKASGGGEAK
jgi:hypothetical protein